MPFLLKTLWLIDEIDQEEDKEEVESEQIRCYISEGFENEEQAICDIESHMESVGMGRPCSLELHNVTNNPKHLRLLTNLMKMKNNTKIKSVSLIKTKENHTELEKIVNDLQNKSNFAKFIKKSSDSGSSYLSNQEINKLGCISRSQKSSQQDPEESNKANYQMSNEDFNQTISKINQHDILNQIEVELDEEGQEDQGKIDFEQSLIFTSFYSRYTH